MFWLLYLRSSTYKKLGWSKDLKGLCHKKNIHHRNCTVGNHLTTFCPMLFLTALIQWRGVWKEQWSHMRPAAPFNVCGIRPSCFHWTHRNEWSRIVHAGAPLHSNSSTVLWCSEEKRSDPDPCSSDEWGSQRLYIYHLSCDKCFLLNNPFKNAHEAQFPLAGAYTAVWFVWSVGPSFVCSHNLHLATHT